MEILLVTQHKAAWSDFLQTLTGKGCAFAIVESLADATAQLRSNTPNLAILDLNLEGQGIRDAVIELLMVNASVHSVVVTDMGADDFHEFTEGLGVLMPLPQNPTAADAEELVKKLAALA